MTVRINRHTDVKNHLAGIGIKVEKRNTTNVLVVKANGCETEFFFYKDGLYAGCRIAPHVRAPSSSRE